VPVQVLSDEPAFWMETLKANRKRRVRVAFPAAVPACGYRAYYAQPRESAAPASGGDWRVDERGAENRHLAFAIAPDGGLDVTDKTTGGVYRGLGHFSDVEDAGDEYSYCPCPVSETISTAGMPAVVSCVANGPVQATFRVAWTLRVPESLRGNRKRRARKRVPLPIVSEITLYRDQPGLYIST
jgi:alpha-mannosidase